MSTVHPDTNSLTPTGCPTVQFWQSLPGVSITSHKLKGKIPNKTALASDVPKLSELLPNWLQIQGFSQPSFMCNNLLQWLTELIENTILKWLQFYYKSCNSKTAKWKTCAEQVSGRGWGIQSFHALSENFRCHAPSTFTNPETPVSGIYTRSFIHFIGMIN